MEESEADAITPSSSSSSSSPAPPPPPPPPPHPALTGDDVTALSKNARKKLVKAARFEEQKLVRRQREKERKRARKDEALAAGTWMPSLSAQRRRTPGEQIAVAATLVIDLGFDALMTDKEISSMTQQLSFLYSSNKYAPRPFAKVLFCGQGRCDPYSLLPKHADKSESRAEQELTLFDSRLGQRMEGKLGGTWRRWTGVALRNRGGLQVVDDAAKDDGVPTLSDALASTTLDDTTDDDDDLAASLLPSRDKIVYLTADTDTTLDTIEEGYAYIIGGLVDRNRYRCLCAEKASRLGFKTARLPIEAERLQSSAVMTVNQVVQIMLTFNLTRSWDIALDKHLPLRKRRDNGKEQQRVSEKGDDDVQATSTPHSP